MCGIGGFKRFGKALVTPFQVTTMLNGLQDRGRHATGLSIAHKSGEVFTMKEDCPAWEFTAKEGYTAFLKKYLTDDVSTVILHARAATKGDPKDNENNHPLTVGQVSVVHNGVLHNDDQLFNSLSLKREAEVDSDIIRAILDSRGLSKKGIEDLNKMRGSAAISAVSNKEPGKLLLARSGNPIVTASTREMLVWASEKRFLHSSMRPLIRRFGLLFQPNIPDCAFNTMPDHSAWLIGETGLEWHDRFELNSTFTPVTYDSHNTFRRNRDKWYTEKLPDVLECPNPECGVANRVQEWAKGEPIWKLACAKCGSPMGAMQTVMA